MKKNLVIFLLFINTQAFCQIKQYQDKWCWAACFEYFTNKTQCEIANIKYPSTPSTPPLTSCECNQDVPNNFTLGFWETSALFTTLNYHSTTVQNFPSFEALREEIDIKNRPVIFFISSILGNKDSNLSDSSVDHFVVCDGLIEHSYDGGIMSIKRVHILDPWGVCNGSTYSANFYELTEGSIDSFYVTNIDDHVEIHGWVKEIYPNPPTFDSPPKATKASTHPEPTTKIIFCKALLPYSTNPTELARNYYVSICDKCSNPNRNIACNFDRNFIREDIRYLVGIGINPNLLIKPRLFTFKNIFYSRKEYIYQVDSVSKIQLRLVQKNQKLLPHYKDDNLEKKTPTKDDFWIVSRIDENFTYLYDYVQKGSALRNVEVTHKNKKKILKTPNTDYKLVSYDFLQTYFFVFKDGCKNYAFFEKDVVFEPKKGQKYIFKAYQSIPLKCLMDILKSKTIEDKKYFDKIPKGTLYSR
jgi:hypothetical protein